MWRKNRTTKGESIARQKAVRPEETKNQTVHAKNKPNLMFVRHGLAESSQDFIECPSTSVGSPRKTHKGGTTSNVLTKKPKARGEIQGPSPGSGRAPTIHGCPFWWGGPVRPLPTNTTLHSDSKQNKSTGTGKNENEDRGSSMG